MSKKVTQQEIAAELNISRNTVSKALNNDPSLGEKSRDLIIQTAIKMGYKKYSTITPSENMSIYLITTQDSISNSFWAPFVRGVERGVSDAGYNLNINIINSYEEDNCLLPRSFENNKPAGIIMSGIFIRKYYEKIKSTGITFVSLDITADVHLKSLMCDVIMMENESCVWELTTHLINLGHKDIGFIGDIGSCRSFMERWMGYQKAMMDAGIRIDEEMCIINQQPRHFYRYNELSQIISGLKKLPTAIVCANDSIAIDTIMCLRERGINVPNDVSITGFDDIPEALVVTPALTTVKCFKEEMGRRSVEELLWRIQNPERPYEIVRISADTIFRSSTREHGALE